MEGRLSMEVTGTPPSLCIEMQLKYFKCVGFCLGEIAFSFSFYAYSSTSALVYAPFCISTANRMIWGSLPRSPYLKYSNYQNQAVHILKERHHLNWVS